MGTRSDFYMILHVQPDAPSEIIKTSYRTLMQGLKMHPDLGGDHVAATLLNEAFATLRDPEKRAAYDQRLAAESQLEDRVRRATAPAGAPAGSGASNRPSAAAAPDVREVTRGQHACLFCGELHSAHDAGQPSAACWRCESPLFPALKQPRSGSSGRSLDRMPRHIAVRIRLPGPDAQAFQATTEDISINGARFPAGLNLDRGQRLALDCAFCIAVGVVRHVEPEPDHRPPVWHIGVEFLTLLIKQPRGVFVSTQA